VSTVGYLYYGSETQPIEFPDRVLAHIRVLATSKLRRGESFTMTWHHPSDEGEGRTSIWMQPSIPLKFVFDSSEAQQLNPEYLQRLAREAATSNGAFIEPDDESLQLTPVGRVPAGIAA
jgi:hypothetical protein